MHVKNVTKDNMFLKFNLILINYLTDDARGHGNPLNKVVGDGGRVQRFDHGSVGTLTGRPVHVLREEVLAEDNITAS